MNKRLTKVFSFTVIVLLALGESSQLVQAVTEEPTATTPVSEEVVPVQETINSTESTTASTEEETEETSSSSTKDSTESTKESKEKADTDKIKPQAANDPVTIPDPALYQWIRATLNHSTYGQSIPDGTPITEVQMEMLTSLTRGSISGDYTSISNLEGLQYAVNLETLNFIGNSTTGRGSDQFTALPTGFKKLTKLKELLCYHGELTDIDELKDHPSLEVFSAAQNKLTSFKGLSGCKELQVINVNGSENNTYNQNGAIANFEGLESATKLREISFNKYNEQRGDTLAKLGEAEPSYVGYGLQSLKGLNCANSLEVLSLAGHPGLHTLDGLENYSKLSKLVVTGSPNYNGRDYYYENPGGVTELVFDPGIHTPTYHTRGLRGANAITALSTCTALSEVNLSNQAIEDISPLAGKTAIKELNLSSNLIQTLTPLLTTNKIVKLDVSNNLLPNLSGIENTDTLEELRCSSQNAGASQMKINASSGTAFYLKGLLSDITAINPKSLKAFYCYSNRLENIDSLIGASNLTHLIANNNQLSDIKGDLSGCTSLQEVNFSNNLFVRFEDMGLEAAKNSLKTLFMKEQGLFTSTTSNYLNTKTLLEKLDGLKQFTVIEIINMETNKVTDAEMVHIPDSIIDLHIGQNELQDKAFSTIKPTTHTRIQRIFASNNHISDITPLEKLPTLTRLYAPGQGIKVPKNGGTATKKTSPIGYEIDVLNTDASGGLSFVQSSGWGTATPSIKAGTNILNIDDPNYDLDSRSPSADFSYTGNSAIVDFVFSGTITFDADYDIATAASVKLVPTDIDGNEITEIPQGGVIYWRATVDSKDAKYLMKPDFRNSLQGTPHAILNLYTEPLDSQASEYVNGARVEIDGVYVPTPAGIWSVVDALDNQINKDKVAVITTVTKVNDNATPGQTANMYFNVQGKNFSRVGETKWVTIKAKAPELLNLSAPERFDFGRKNEASKKAQTYSLDTKRHSASEQTDGFKVRVTDSMQTTNRVDWKVVGKLSELTNSKGNALKTAAVSPKLTLSDISLYKIADAGGAETATPIPNGTSGNPTWQKSLALTAGGSSVTLSEAPKADGEGVWDYRVPFDKVKLEVPANVNGQAGYTFNGKLTWTLDDTL
ncbi:hypothetical protein [Candidatus Enterococcus murrayae]|uniref:WxL domain-containing protein n=1 Tax=Candidatus Enterococcus murrayae TaxID=2815321 RepID=A0ABS3HMT9_9ENTE|nr:hypothetical protein [Enterococcus sp. MJM16]MBO0454753.1 hypothetical protein [Enterococcus sp. MJM16]